MAHDTHAAHADSHHAPHPPVPTVTDEAGDSPMWLPVTGLALMALLCLFALYRTANPSTSPAAEALDVEAAAAPAAAEPAAAPAAAAPAAH